MSATRAPLVLTCLTLAATTLFAQQPVPGFADAILGSWDLTVQGAGGPYPSWLEIPGITGGALDSHEVAPGPLMLHGDHGKVMFRKIVLTPAI